MPALALTDHYNLTGAVSFYLSCKKANVKPVLGLEIDLLLPFQLSPALSNPVTGTLVLLAQDVSGWKNIVRLSSAILSAPEDSPRLCTLDMLSRHAGGLICLTGGTRGALQRLLDLPEGERECQYLSGALSEIYTGCLYIEIANQSSGDPGKNKRLGDIASQSGLPCVAAHSIYYCEPDQARMQRTISAIREITPLSRLPLSAAAPPNAYFLSPAELEVRFSNQPDALAASMEITDRCNLDLPLGQPHYPAVPLPERVSAVEVLRQKAMEGARKLYGENAPGVTQRIEQELEVIQARGYAPVFLIAEEMVAFAHQNDIPSASRGSASSSLIAHCIGITTPDPLSLDLYFERFLNPARTTPPDIDTDFCSRRRDEVIQHLFDRYGQEKVAMVGTINTFRPRSALSEVAKAHGLSQAEVRSLVNNIHHFYYHPQMREGEQDPYLEIRAQHGQNARVMEIVDDASNLIGCPHHLSVHAGGVVIAPGPIVDYVPVTRSGGKGMTITQFDLDDVEHIGLVKLDLLGIRGLTVLGDVASSIRSWRRKEYSRSLDILDAVPEDDADTANLVASGRTIGCFQIESPGMSATLKEIQARSVPDIMAALALYRPGPLKGGLRDAFVRRHKRIEAVTPIHPTLSGLLRETYGVILYQEQVLRIAHDLAGFSFSEADLLRRAMSHFDPGKQMQVLQEKFISGASRISGVPPETGARIWEMMAAFAGYGFPKAHAASYAQVAWRSAWCKAHFPAEFLAAVLANWGGYYPQAVYLAEARRLGLSVRPPHINFAHPQFSVSYPDGGPVLYMGLDQVRDLSHRTQARIQRFRPFTSLAGFLQKVDPRIAEAGNLIQVGALSGLGTIPDLLNELQHGFHQPGQLSLFSQVESSGEDWPVEQKVEAQQRLLGASIEAHPLELHAASIRASGAISTSAAALRTGARVRVAGMRQATHRSLTAQKDWMGFLTLEDLEGMIDVIIFPDVYRSCKSALSVSSLIPLVVEGLVESDPGTAEPLLRAEKIWPVKT